MDYDAGWMCSAQSRQHGRQLGQMQEGSLALGMYEPHGLTIQEPAARAPNNDSMITGDTPQQCGPYLEHGPPLGGDDGIRLVLEGLSQQLLIGVGAIPGCQQGVT
jgi:hypothetical protein